MEKLTIVKVGGKVVEEPASLSQLLSLFENMPGKKLLVHGGGRSATALAADLGIETQMIDGRRITDEKMLRVVTMVYAGQVNKNIVARLQALGMNALGLTGADLGVMRSDKRAPKNGIDFGFVGDVTEVDTTILSALIQKDVVPVMAPITHNGMGSLLNTNADIVAGELAIALSKTFDVNLIYCFEKKGVLADRDDEESVIHKLTLPKVKDMIEKKEIADGMIPKLDGAFRSLYSGVKKVYITKASDISNLNLGTEIIVK